MSCRKALTVICILIPVSLCLASSTSAAQPRQDETPEGPQAKLNLVEEENAADSGSEASTGNALEGSASAQASIEMTVSPQVVPNEPIPCTSVVISNCPPPVVNCCQVVVCCKPAPPCHAPRRGLFQRIFCR